MTFEAFQDHIYETVSEHFREAAETHLTQVRKNNGVTLTGIFLDHGIENEATPIVYLEPFFDASLTEPELFPIISNIIGTLASARMPEAEMLNFFDFEAVRKYIVFRLLGRKQNEEMLKSLVSRSFLDMEIIYCVAVIQEERGLSAMKITRELMHVWGVTEEEIYEAALENSPRILGARLESMSDLLLGDQASQKEYNEPFAVDSMYVLSNLHSTYGASAVLYASELRELAEWLTIDLLILPSSIHEVILVPKVPGGEFSHLPELVKYVNETQVAVEDVLTDQVYVYSFRDKSFRVFEGEESEKSD